MSEQKIDYEAVIAYIRSKVSMEPELGIVCGSGLSGLSKTLNNPFTIHYSELKQFGFPQPTVAGHVGELVFGMLGGKRVVCMRGRFHYYEGYAPSQVSCPIRILAALGIKVLLVTNASGGVNAGYKVGELMLIKDHISFCALGGVHPLVGPNDNRFGPRFFATNGVYDPKLRALALKAARDLKFPFTVHEGVYCGVSGPSYETPHDIKFLRLLGGGAVGMSTVFEVLAAAQLGIPVLGISVITNRCLGPDDNYVPPTHQEVLDNSAAAEVGLTNLVQTVVDRMDVSAYKHSVAYTSFRSRL